MQDISTRRFFIILTLLCLTYLGFEWWFNQYAMISVDEFWFAHRIYQYKDGLPYRDFAPYKTVLGYYLLLLPMTLAHGILPTLLFTKNIIALANTCVIYFSCLWLTRFFSRGGVIIGLCVMLSMEIMLSYSTQIRVDLIAYWFCLFSLLGLLEKRFLLAGLLLGLGFATSQKAIWYLVASNAALGMHWFLSERNRHYMANIIKFNLTVAAVMTVYMILWSCLAGLPTVLNSVLIEASAMYHLDWYDASRKLYWTIILLLNPLAFSLWPLTLLSLMVTFPSDRCYALRRFIIVYAMVILLCLIPYKQVFPYYMQVTLPVFLVLYAAFFSWVIDYQFTNEQRTWVIPLKWPHLFSAAYVLIVTAIIWLFTLPYAYLLINLMPFLLLSPRWHRLLCMNLLLIGCIYPFTLYTKKIISINGDYQKANLVVINHLLQDGSDYTAGIELIYNKTQPIAGLRHLMGPAIDYLYAPTTHLLPVMTASLYEDPTVSIASVNHDLLHSRVKFYVNNYRMEALPPAIKHYLANHYQHLWGSIYLYAPVIPAGTQHSSIQFSGIYRLQADSSHPITINHTLYANGAELSVHAGILTTASTHPFRLVLRPAANLLLDRKFTHDEWEKIIF